MAYCREGIRGRLTAVASSRLRSNAQDDWTYALEALNRTLELEPRRFDAYYLLGSTLERAEQPEAALRAYQEALDIYPAYELAGRNAARIRAQLRGRSL